MTGFNSKRQMAQDRLDDDDIQVYAKPAQKLMVYEFGCSQCGHTQNEEIDIPQRQWVGLTAKEAAECWTTRAAQTWKNFEAKLKEKNT